MAIQKVNPLERLEQAVDSLEALSEFLKQAAADDATQMFVLEHLANVANALSTMKSVLHLIGHVNAPALADAQAAHLQCMQEAAGQAH